MRQGQKIFNALLLKYGEALSVVRIQCLSSKEEYGERKNNNFTVEKPGRRHLNQVVEVCITNGESHGRHGPSAAMQCGHLTSEAVSRNPEARLITRRHQTNSN